jgi:hypothetical protein
MADDTQVTGITAAGLATPPEPTLAQTPSTTEAAPETPETPVYVTKEELDQLMAETLRRAKQSDRDRMKQIDEKLTTIKARLEAGGDQLTPSQVNVLREQIEEEGNVTQAQAPASALTPEMQAQADFVFMQIDETFADMGIQVTVNDPEWKGIKDALDDPKGSLAKAIRAATKAADAKAARVASQKDNAAARTVSGGGSQTQTAGTFVATSSQDYWKNAHK